MMLDLIRDIGFNRAAMGRTYRKRAVAWLPREVFDPDRFVNPSRGGLLEVLYEYGKRVRGTQACHQVDMICSAANRRRNGIGRANQSAKIFMQSLPPSIRNEGVAVFGGEHDMEMKA